jgi:hypothetical protein
MRLVIDATVAASLALMPVGYAQAAKRIHKAVAVREAPWVRAASSPPAYFPHNAAAEGNNANSMSGSNSAVENPIGHTNCC